MKPKITTLRRQTAEMKRLDRLRSARSSFVKVGVVGGVRSDSGLTNAELASIHEYGTSNVPARPFIGPTVMKHRADYEKAIIEAYKKAKTAEEYQRALGLIGAKAAADVKKTITAGIPPALSARTIAQKGSTTPLIDTGQLLNSITWKVEK